MESEDLLAHKLTQLEMGYPLDEIGADLPEQEARLLHLAALEFIGDDGLKLSASLSYYTLFSMAPMLIIIIAMRRK